MIVVAIIITILILSVTFLFYASYNIQSGIYLRAFCHKQTEERVVALTFDDGPAPVETPRVLEVLKTYNAPACFFCIGSRVPGNEPLLRQMITEGHLIGNHSYSHAGTFPLFGLKRMKEDLQACQRELDRAIGKQEFKDQPDSQEAMSQSALLFRPPFGVTNPTIAKAVRQLGYTPIGWNIRTFDTQQGATPEKIRQRIRRKLRPGSVILLHDRMPQSAERLKQILDFLREENYKVVRLDELMNH